MTQVVGGVTMLTAANPQLAVCLTLAQAIGRTRTVEEIYGIALDALGQGLGVARSSILLFDDDGVMRFEAWRGLTEGYRRAVEGHTPWAPDTPDPEPILVPDIVAEPSLAPYLPAIVAEGIAAMAFIPLVSQRRVIGKFMAYDAVPHPWTGDEMELAGLIASQVAFAVERTRAEAQARRSEARLRFALDAANMGTWDWDLRTRSLRWSENVERIHGLPAGTFDGSFESYEREIHPLDRERVLGSLRRALEEGTPHDVEYRIVAPDGTVRWVEGKGTVERGPDGAAIGMSGVCLNVTARKEAEVARVEALEASHRASRQLAAIVASSGDAIVSKDLDGVIRSWNRAAEQLFGYTPAEAIGRSILLIIPAERQAEEQLVLSRIRAGERVEMETVRRHKDGTLIPISLMVSPIEDGDGRIVGASKVARDIRARKRDEAERAELHRRLATLVAASASLLDSPETDAVLAGTIAVAQRLLVADAYAVWASDGAGSPWRVVRAEGVSDAFAESVIDAPGAAVPLPPAPVAVPDVFTHPMVEARRSAHAREGIRSMLVCPMRLGTGRLGTIVFYYRTPHAFSDLDVESGQALANLAASAMTTADLYARLRAQRNAAEAARRRASFLADATAILSRSLDYEQTLAAVARLAVPEIADWCAVDIVGDRGELQRLAAAHVDPEKVEYARVLHERYPPDPSAPGGVHEVIRTGRPLIVESVTAEALAAHARDADHLRILSELALTSVLCVPIVSPSGTTGVITFVYAESGRHYTPDDLQFAQEVAARAALAIENAFAYRRVNDASRLKDEFLATLSHELRTPLNAILGYSQMLDMGVLQGADETNAIAVLRRNADSLKQIIDDVLDVSRITSGKLRLSVRPVHLADILDNAVATVRPAADAKGVRLEREIVPGVPAVSGDPDRLQQVVWNLLSNAVKFTGRGGRVRLRLHDADSMVQVVVSDDGQGIDAAFLPHIFERFRQADSRFSREHGGLGLGLAIVRELTELHGGTVRAWSDGPGTGATFRVSLPPLTEDRTASGPGRGNQAHAAVATARDLPARLHGVTVLAVDNEDDALGLLRAILERAGATVRTAGSGRVALELLRHAPFDALIADIGMPGMDGLSLIREVRTSLPAPASQVPGIALTAYARAEDQASALASGYDVHVAKPVDAAGLVTAVATLLGR